MNKNTAVVLLLVLAAGCTTNPRDEPSVPPMDPSRKVSERDCSKAFDNDGGNLMCREVTEAERRARIADEERQASEKAAETHEAASYSSGAGPSDALVGRAQTWHSTTSRGHFQRMGTRSLTPRLTTSRAGPQRSFKKQFG